MKETSKHLDAFETYYSLGGYRSLAKLHLAIKKVAPSKKESPALRTLKSWSILFDWQGRLMTRDREISHKVERRVVRDEVDHRVAVLEKLKQEEELYTMQEESAHTNDKDGKPYLREDMQPHTANDLHRTQEGKRKNLELQWRITSPEDANTGNKVEISIKTVSKLQDKN